MEELGLNITKLIVEGPGKADTSLQFRQGLNLIAGASNTGKTYVWQLIDFMLGASTPPKDIPPAMGYSHAILELQSRNGTAWTFKRALSGGEAQLYKVPASDISQVPHAIQLGERHVGGRLDTISGQLLDILGLAGKQLRKDAQGAKKSLSFRDLAWLAMVDEKRIITEDSPVLTGQYISPTEEKAAFGLLVTGVDDAAIITQEKPEVRKARLKTEQLILQSLVEDHEKQFRSFSIGLSELAAQRERLTLAISEANVLLATQQSELNRVAGERDEAWSELQSLGSSRLFLHEQRKRLQLLQSHYSSDAARLNSALEAGELFEKMPSGVCPVCGKVSDAQPTGQTDVHLREFQTACQGELTKISILSRDLSESLNQMNSEDEQLRLRQDARTEILNRSNREIEELLNVKVNVVSAQLSQLLAEQGRLAEAAFTAKEMTNLQSRYTATVTQLAQKIKRPKFTTKIGAASLTEFCKVVTETLRAWHFPLSGNVAWSETKTDFVIGSENRGSMGKGYRAITFAAFVISLMRYCRIRNLPHPGFVILDTPLNPYKGPDKTDKEGVDLDVQEAFYADISKESSGDQIIIFENTEPPTQLRSSMNYVHFSGKSQVGRAGFFPVA